MDSTLLSRITKDFLNLDPARVSPKERYRAGWGGSVLMPHRKAPSKRRERREEVERILGERKRAANYFPKGLVDLATAPKLSLPKVLPNRGISPAMLFSRGPLENDKRKNPEPIRYLLMETDEVSKARPIPGNNQFLRSLCKGKGVLKRNSAGLIYLDIDNRFISMMLPLLKSRHLVRPPYFDLFTEPDGAHIPVIPAREAAFQYLSEIEEVNREFTFEIKGLYSMKPATWPEVEEVWFFKIHSPELENLRRKYFLPEHPNGHPFHITVAVKPRTGAKGNAPHSTYTMRINAAILVA